MPESTASGGPGAEPAGGPATAGQAVTVADHLAAHARRDPGRVAVDDGGPAGPVTYGELDAHVDRVAGALVAALSPPRGDRPVVAVITTAAPALVTASLAVARAGMVSVAVDPADPVDRRDAVLDDAGAVLALVDGVDAGAVTPITVLELSEARIAPPLPAPVPVELDDLSAILYTSGSTGRPKGVRFSHRARLGVAHALPADTTGPGVRSCAVDIGSSGGAEGVHVAPLVMGGTLLPFAVERSGISALPDFLRQRRATAFRGVPTLVRHLITLVDPGERLTELRALALFGERLGWPDVGRFRMVLATDAVIHNSYGSTETGVLTTFTVAAGDPLGAGLLPAGRPVAGRRIAIVDDDGRPVDAGVDGHVVAVGRSLPTGYWNRPAETAAVFGTDETGAVTCRTGDLGHLEADGTLVVRGRADDVVKIAGHRVELGEVETALAAVPGVQEAAATARADAHGDLRLLAYAVLDPAAAPDAAVLRAALARRLPRPMVPDVVLVLDELPRLPGGKVDRERLPDRPGRSPDVPVPGPDASDGSLTATLHRIVAEVLDLPVAAVGLDDDFFALGGDSLRAVQLFVALEERLDLALAPEVLLEAPTVRALAGALASGRAMDPSGSVLPVRPAGPRPPLFVLPGVGGQVWEARRLAGALPADQPVYVIQSPEVRGLPSPDRIEVLATGYVADIRTVEPDGPYLLFGSSAGGVVAFEMARQLRAEGSPVGLVALGDSRPPGLRPTDLPSLRWLRRRGQLPWRSLPTAARWDAVRLRRRLQRATATRRPSSLGPPGMAPEVARARARQRDVVRRSYRAHLDYRPGPFDGDVLLFHCRTTDLPLASAWRPLVTGTLEVVEVDADHNDLLFEPALTQVADALERAVQRALRTPRERARPDEG